MPAKCRVIVCGFDPMLVRGYVKTGARALWWYLPDEIVEKYNTKPGDRIRGKVLAVYWGKDGKKVSSPNEPFEWRCTKETGYAVELPPEAIIKYQLTCSHFLELVIEEIVKGEDEEENEIIPVYPGEEVISSKWWPEDMMVIDFAPPFQAP